MFYLIVFILIVAAFFLFYLYKKKEKNALESALVKKENPAFHELLVLNINIRKKIFSKTVIQDTEIIIDKLREVLPTLNEKYHISELTWVANKMATDYLQKVLNPYMNFQAEIQDQKKDDLLASLKQIEQELDEIIELVKQNETSQFDTKAKFIKNRFK